MQSSMVDTSQRGLESVFLSIVMEDLLPEKEKLKNIYD